MIVYRISKKQYIHDLTGFGAANFPGRWNSKGVYVLYTAATPSLALLESVVHITSLVQVEYSLAKIFIPDDLIVEISTTDLPENWYVFPAPGDLKKFGDDFVRENKFLTLKVPSSIMPEDTNLLINPAHPAFSKVKILSVRQLDIDSRLVH